MKGLTIATPPRSEWFPIGSIYISVDTTNPGTIFGGTWEQIKDKFLLCSGSTYGNGTTGGSATHLHSTTAIALTEAQIPSHSHREVFELSSGYVRPLAAGASGSYTESTAITDGTYKEPTSFLGNSSASSTNPVYPIRTMSTGSGATHTHGNTSSTSTLPPYLAVVVWKRTA